MTPHRERTLPFDAALPGGSIYNCGFRRQSPAQDSCVLSCFYQGFHFGIRDHPQKGIPIAELVL